MSYRKNSELLSDFDLKDLIKSTKRIANNTLEIVLSNGTKIIRFHNTDIITTKNGEITFNTDGHRTVTTKERLNKFNPLNLRISQRNHQWYIGEYDFYDGITFNKNGELISEDKTIDQAKWKKAEKDIIKFTNLVDKLEKIPFPNAGDCWYCALVTKEGIPMGEISRDYSHLVLHIKQEYMHGSLILNALKEAGYSDWLISSVFHGDDFFGEHKATIKRTLRRYLKKRLLNEKYYDFEEVD